MAGEVTTQVSRDPLLKEGLSIDNLAQEMIFSQLGKRRAQNIRAKVNELLVEWEGRELDVLTVLHHAARKGKIGTYLRKLKQIYDEDLSWVPKDFRRYCDAPAVNRVECRVSRLYKEMRLN